MKFRFTLLLLVFCFFLGSAQENKWNVEANYTIVPGDGVFGEDNFIDLGVKYRFVTLGIFNVGFGVNGGFSRVNVENTGFESRTDDTYLVQPRFFTDMQIPGFNKLRPSLGLGASYVNVVTDITTQNGFEDQSNSNQIGFNFNLGLSYDFSRNFFIQAQYDFIDLTPEDDTPDDIVFINPPVNGNINNIRLGIGFRF